MRQQLCCAAAVAVIMSTKRVTRMFCTSRPRRDRRLTAMGALCIALSPSCCTTSWGGPGGERYVVRMTLDEPHARGAVLGLGGTAVSCGGHNASSCAECPQGHGALWCNGICHWVSDRCVPLSDPGAVSLTIRGHGFNCQIPAPSSQSTERQRRASHYVAGARVAALIGQCLIGRIPSQSGICEGQPATDGKSSDMTCPSGGGAQTSGNLEGGEASPTFELCIGKHVICGGTTAMHEASLDEALRGGGFTQTYRGPSSRGTQFVVRVICDCLEASPGPELPCQPGDVVRVLGLDGANYTAAIAGHTDDEGELVSIMWLSSGIKVPDPRTDSRPLVSRSSVFLHDGARMCSKLPVKSPNVWRITSATPTLTSFDDLADNNIILPVPPPFDVHIAALPCCSARQLRQPPNGGDVAFAADVEHRRLLAAIGGKCIQYLSGWWTYELCWPWRVRRLHYATDGMVDSPATELGRFGEASLHEQRAEPRQRGWRRLELVTNLEGAACGDTVLKWLISIVSESAAPERSPFTGLAGSFGPSDINDVEGHLFLDELNLDGCMPFQNKSAVGAILLVKRGNCWFHHKVLHAQDSGASGLIIYNDQQRMIIMEGVFELPSPRIPSLLVESDIGARLRKYVGMQSKLSKAGEDGVDISRPLSTSVVFRCNDEWYERREVCQPGDAVEVKVHSQSKTESWPYTAAVNVHYAVVADVRRDGSGTLEVRWQPRFEDDNVTALPLVVPQKWSFRNGVACDTNVDAYIETVSEIQARSCRFEMSVHVASLCAHPRLVPPQPREAQTIHCNADRATRDQLERQQEMREAGTATQYDRNTV